MDPAVELDRVSYRYPGAAEPALDGVSLRVEPGERLGILGPNGAGKSTLLRLVLGLIEPTEGAVRVLGRDASIARRGHLVASVPQRGEAELSFPLSVRQVVGLGAGVGVAAWRGLKPDGRARVKEALELTGVAALAERPIGRLSGGQRQRVLVARAVAAAPKLMLLDEPAVGVDVEGQHRFTGMLAGLRERFGLTIIVVSHDIRTIAATSDRVACLRRTLHSHTAPEGLTPAVLAEVFRHDVEEVFGEELHVDAHPAAACDDPSHEGHGHEGHGHAH